MFYVYELVDPRDGKTFYVGKGKGKRRFEHVLDAKKGVPGLKCDRIREVIACGLDIEVRVIKEFRSEDAAYRYEARVIKRIGLENLTNVSPGGRIQFPVEPAGRKEARESVRALAKMARKLSTYRDLRFWFLGKWHDLARDDAIKILFAGMRKVVDILGESATRAEFKKFNVTIENSGKQCHS